MKKEIYNELVEIAPTLARMERKNPFIVPAEYFETLQEITMKNQASTAVPDGYFDHLGGEIWQKINGKDTTKKVLTPAKKPKTYRLFSPVIMGVAASLLLLVMSVVLIDQKNESVQDFTMEMVEDEELLAYIETNLTEFDDTFIVSDYTDDFTAVIEDATNEDINEMIDNLSEINLEELNLDDVDIEEINQ